MCTFWHKNIYSFQLEKSSLFVQPQNDKQGKLAAMNKKGKQGHTRADAFTQKWCVRFAFALVAYR